MDAFAAKTPESFRQACSRFIFTENFVSDPEAPKSGRTALRPMKEAVELIGKAMEELEEDAQGWRLLGAVGTRINNLSSEFDARTYGHAKLSSLVDASGRFEIDRSGQQLRIRPRK